MNHRSLPSSNDGAAKTAIVDPERAIVDGE
jgi:hypothetical protein